MSSAKWWPSPLGLNELRENFDAEVYNILSEVPTDELYVGLDIRKSAENSLIYCDLLIVQTTVMLTLGIGTIIVWMAIGAI